MSYFPLYLATKIVASALWESESQVTRPFWFLPIFRSTATSIFPTALFEVSTPISVQKLQTALHAKAKSEASYLIYALYDKIYREDMQGNAYAPYRSHKGAPGVDRQNFADVKAYWVQ